MGLFQLFSVSVYRNEPKLNFEAEKNKSFIKKLFNYNQF